MTIDEFITRIEKIGFTVVDSDIKNSIYFYSYYHLEIRVYIFNETTSSIYIYDNTGEVYLVYEYFDIGLNDINLNYKLDKTFSFLNSIPDIQYLIREKKLNKILKK